MKNANLDDDVSEWLYESGRLTGVECHEAWFETLCDAEKDRFRQEYAERPGAKKMPATYAFDPKQVRIERHRVSTTQGEYSVFYRDQCLGRYGDTIKLTDGTDAQGHSIWAGISDEDVLKWVRTLYVDGYKSKQNVNKPTSIPPLCHRDILHLLKQGEAVVLSDEMFDTLCGDFESNIASISNTNQVGTLDVWLVGTIEALKRVEPVRMAHKAMDRLVEALNARYPEAGLSFGYIGNLSMDGGDDRTWHVFTKIPEDKNPFPRGHTYRYPRNYSWEGASTDGVPAMADRAEKDLEIFVRRALGLEPWPVIKRPSAGIGM